MEIGLFVTCLNDTLYPSTGRAVVTVLERMGHRVIFPAGQTCSRQMHLYSGYRSDATMLARNFVRTFGDIDVIVSPSASCVGTVRDMYGYLATTVDDVKLLEEATQLSKRIFEFSQLLVDVLGVIDVDAYCPRRDLGSNRCRRVSTEVSWSIHGQRGKGDGSTLERGAVRHIQRDIRDAPHFRFASEEHVGSGLWAPGRAR